MRLLYIRYTRYLAVDSVYGQSVKLSFHEWSSTCNFRFIMDGNFDCCFSVIAGTLW